MKLKLLAALPLLTLAAHAQLQTVLDKLDKASAGFKNAQAEVRYDNYTKVVKAHDIQTGFLYIERTGKTESMGARFFDPSDLKTPSRVLNYGDGKLAMYSPGTNQEDIFNAGANQAKYESFLTLGFGGSGKDLATNWNITDVKSETVNGTVCEELDLVAKQDSVKTMFTHVTIWVDLNRGVSLRQIFYQPGGDMRTADYTNIKTKVSKIDKKPYEISSKAQRIVH
jgi:hypothetical protein